MTGRTGRGADAGSPSVELVLLTPALILVLLMIVACARLTTARLRVAQAAPAAARAASLARTPQAARAAAAAIARHLLTGGGTSCVRYGADVRTGAWRSGGTVDVRVTCTIALADLSPLRLPGHRTISGGATSVLDRYRGTSTGAS